VHVTKFYTSSIMSFAANPNKIKRTPIDIETATVAKQHKADRERIRRLLITLGDDNKKVVGQIRGLAGALEDDVELHGELMADTVMDCAKHIPLKTGIYAAWVARMAEKHKKWVGLLVPKAVDEFRCALRSGHSTIAQLLLQFIINLGNYGVIGLAGVVDFLQDVLALSDGLRPAKGGDLGIFLMLSSLPFLSAASHANIDEKVNAMISKADAYLNSREARWKPLLRILKSEEIPDRLEALAGAVRSMKQTGWNSQSVLHVPGFEPNLQGGSSFSELAALGVSADEIRKNKIRFHVPLVSSRFLTCHAEVDGADDHLADHDRWVLENYILMTIEMFGRDVDECAKHILSIPVMHSQFEIIVVETVFSQMLRLPSPPSLPLFYSRLLEAMMDKQNSTKAIVEHCYRTLIDRAPDMDDECLEVLAEAHAYHLMHNGYQMDWKPFTGDRVAVQAQRFVRRVFERLQRLSFHQNLLHRLPEAVHVYVPCEPIAASSLPVQAKPEFQKMISLVRIKEPDYQQVLQYCRGLLKNDPQNAFCQGDTIDEKLEVEGVIEDEMQEGVELNKCDHGPPLKRPRVHERELLTDVDKSPTCIEGISENITARIDASELDGAGVDGTITKAQVKQEYGHESFSGHLTAETCRTQDARSREDFRLNQSDHSNVADVSGEPWTLGTVVEVLTCALLQNGAKTPTHMSKILDGHQQVFAHLCPKSDEEKYAFSTAIVRCVFAFWIMSSQRLEITIDCMLHREIVTPRAVVEYALAERGPQGCDSMAVRNVINNIAKKSLERSQSVRAELAIAKKLGKTEELEECRRQLDTAIHETADLFTVIFTGLVRNHQDFEDTDTLLRHIMLQRILTIGRKYHMFIKPLIDTAESRIPGVAHNPDIAAIFHSLSTM